MNAAGRKFNYRLGWLPQPTIRKAMRKAAREWEGVTLLNKHIDYDTIDIVMALGGKCE